MHTDANNDDDGGWCEEIYFREITNPAIDFERAYITERDSSIRNIWDTFEQSASSITHLYKDKSANNETGSLWLPFQTAAGTVTNLYKQSCDGLRRTGETAVQCGYQRRTKELADWAKKRRRLIKREDLLSYLAGKNEKPPPPIHISRSHNIRSSPKPESNHHSHHHHHHHHSHHHVSGSNHSLDTFKEALARRTRAPELHTFIQHEIARHGKRPGSPYDVNMDAPNYSSKRQRYL